MSDKTSASETSDLNDKASISSSEAHGAPNHYQAKQGLEDATGETPDAHDHAEATGVHAQPPSEFTGLKLGKRKEVAAGVPALLERLRVIPAGTSVPAARL